MLADERWLGCNRERKGEQSRKAAGAWPRSSVSWDGPGSLLLLGGDTLSFGQV